MDYRRKKQTIIVAILALILVLLGVGVYYKWFYRAATCFDGRQNQNEEGVDCGGACAMSCELLTVRKLEAQWVKAVFLKDGFYDLVAKVENLNPNYGLESFNYVFKLFDAAGQIIAQKDGASFILPDQSKYIIEANVFLPGKPAKVELTIVDPVQTDWRRLKNNFESPDIYVHDKQFKYLEGAQAGGQMGSAQASGIIKNNSNFDFDRIAVAVILFDEQEEIIGVNRTEARTVLAGEERYFSTLWFSPLAGEVKSMDILIDTNLFSDDNFMRRFGETEKFQEY